MNVLIVVTHLLGTGHLARALTLARAIGKSGDRVTVVSGGLPAPHLDLGDVPLLQLPGLRSDGTDFTRLLTQDDTLADAGFMASRRANLLGFFASQRWDAVVTELFPFGRRILRSEFLALLEATHAQAERPLIYASIRDILAPPSRPEKAEKTDAILARFYDSVLVHADAKVTPLELSWPVSAALAPKLLYTGFVAPPPAADHPQRDGTDEIIVSAGGGNVGADIFATAMQAAAASPRVWRLLLGGSDATERARHMMQNAPPNVIVEPARADFRNMLNHAAASVCMCGYNTALDVLQSGCRAVFVPFDAGTEVEQSLRADALAQLDGIRVLRNADLTPDSLLACLSQIEAAPRRTATGYRFDGAAQTAALLRDRHEARQ